ncbi:3506_t:CDS:2 [Paraglomus brasilianum]|uniref:Ribokinase n=1 Tax=Paraglomus brasilianum TaxID=144538 RepID=A0A9N9A5P1_9GLOM|nr:3506_t:CDS:2 [Paraglomus brasilianum]
MSSSEPKVLVFGSINIDDFFAVPHIVQSGETLLSTGYQKRAGGKGANQSVAIAKAAIKNVYHAGKIGEDGEWIKDYMTSIGVNMDNVHVSKSQSTGRAIVQVSRATHDNAIVLLSGANHQITSQDATNVLGHFNRGDWLVMQNEINDGGAIVKLFKDKGLVVVFNPAPMVPNITEQFDFSHVDHLILNQHEARQIHPQLSLSRNSDSKQRSDDIAGRETDDISDLRIIMNDISAAFPRITTIIITLGRHGVIAKFKGDDDVFQWDAVKSVARDTTAAGDCFTGYYVAGLIRGFSVDEPVSGERMKNAIKMATVASGLAVTREGAMDSIPTMEEVEARMIELKWI